MVHRMEEVSTETEHTIKLVEWADRHHRKNSIPTADEQQKQEELRALYRRSILNSNVRVVDGDELTAYHKAANYVQANPFKLILSIGIPAVAYIFYGKTGKDHCKFILFGISTSFPLIIGTSMNTHLTIIIVSFSVLAAQDSSYTSFGSIHSDLYIVGCHGLERNDGSSWKVYYSSRSGTTCPGNGKDSHGFDGSTRLPSPTTSLDHEGQAWPRVKNKQKMFRRDVFLSKISYS